ncbi:MAG: right-handed parallel beta-helix repeat-containing protein [Methanosarcina sp.]
MKKRNWICKWKNRKNVGIYIVILFFLILTGTASISLTPDMTVYVAGDSSGDFNCDGEADQVEINQALKFVAENPDYTTVYLKGPFTYTIDETIYIHSNTTLKGDSDAVVKLIDRAGWTNKPMIPLIGKYGDSKITNVTISGFEIDGNHDGNTGHSKGQGYYNMIYFNNATNITVCNMYMHDGHGDGLRINYGENIQFYNNNIYQLGHDGLYAIESYNVKAWNNTITCRTNSGLRVWNSNHVKFYDNVIDSTYDRSAGGPGIQIQKSSAVMDDIEVYNNVIHNTFGPGLWLIGYDSSYSKEEARNVHIHHNIFYSTGTNPSIDWVGGIVISGFYDTLIENNVFDGVYHAAVVHMYPDGKSADLSPKGKGYTTIVRNNIIANTLERKKSSLGTGYGVINYLPESHSFVIHNNRLYNNKGGDFINATSTGSVYENPLFASRRNHDYHLKSTGGRWNGKTWVKDRVISPCIDAGYSSSDYSQEPEDNGDRINIGRYGNTEEASKSGIMPGYQAWWYKVSQVSPLGLKILRTLIRIFFFI